MSRDLDVLLRWATDKAVHDDDQSARPLWARIAAEVEAYQAGDLVVTAPPPDTPNLFGGGTP